MTAEFTAMPIKPITHAQSSAPATPNPTATNEISPASPDFSCPQCACNFKLRIGLVGHLRFHRTEASETVPGTPTYTRHVRLHCSHCSCTFTHRMGLLGHMGLHDNLQ
ncbi:unnamed protein product [Schistocephalus solidus]|uniref:C2H2-type domain-containing protein n=1 Tax=Schistocephalus solidus TaxID=70667 RepID=A0A183TQE8_SCHSO|nr:unnamed protein product [Schistocephalus solidus]